MPIRIKHQNKKSVSTPQLDMAPAGYDRETYLKAFYAAFEMVFGCCADPHEQGEAERGFRVADYRAARQALADFTPLEVAVVLCAVLISRDSGPEAVPLDNLSSVTFLNDALDDGLVFLSPTPDALALNRGACGPIEAILLDAKVRIRGQ